MSENDEVYILLSPSNLAAEIRGCHTTKQNIVDVINSAEHNLTIVGYMVSSSEIVDLIKRRASEIEVYLHIDKLQANSYPEAAESARDIENAGAFVKFHDDTISGSLHAKVIISDDKEAIIGSANFTHSGTDRNFEMGVRLKGPSVKIMKNAVLRALGGF